MQKYLPYILITICLHLVIAMAIGGAGDEETAMKLFIGDGLYQIFVEILIAIFCVYKIANEEVEVEEEPMTTAIAVREPEPPLKMYWLKKKDEDIYIIGSDAYVTHPPSYFIFPFIKKHVN